MLKAPANLLYVNVCLTPPSVWPVRSFFLEDADALATEFRDEILGKSAPEAKPWGMYEFAVFDPDETLVRAGRPTRPGRSK